MLFLVIIVADLRRSKVRRAPGQRHGRGNCRDRQVGEKGVQDRIKMRLSAQSNSSSRKSSLTRRKVHRYAQGNFLRNRSKQASQQPCRWKVAYRLQIRQNACNWAEIDQRFGPHLYASPSRTLCRPNWTFRWQSRLEGHWSTWVCACSRTNQNYTAPWICYWVNAIRIDTSRAEYIAERVRAPVQIRFNPDKQPDAATDQVPEGFIPDLVRTALQVAGWNTVI